MADLLVQRAVVNGLGCTAQSTPDKTVNIAGGLYRFDNVAQAPAGNSAFDILGAHPSSALDRFDFIDLDSAGNIVLTVGTPGSPPGATQDSTKLSAWLVTVGAGATVITNDMLYDLRGGNAPPGVTPSQAFVPLPELGHSMAYTFLSGARSSVDPGSGNFGFDATTNAGIAHLYISYINATSPVAHYWLQGGNTGSPPPFRFVRFWSRKDPGVWWLAAVTSFTNHTTWADLAIIFVASSGGGTGPPLSTDSLDTLIAFEETAGLANGQATLGADVTLTPVNTMVDLLNTGSLPVGTYLLTATAAFAGTAAHIGTLRLWDGTTTYAEAEIGIAASAGSVSLDAIVVLNAATTLKISAASDTGTTDTVKAAVTKNSAGNFATILTWVRVA